LSYHLPAYQRFLNRKDYHNCTLADAIQAIQVIPPKLVGGCRGAGCHNNNVSDMEFNSNQTARKYASQSITAGSLWMVGDVLCQGITYRQRQPAPVSPDGAQMTGTVSKEKFSVDWSRALTMTAFGVGIAGPLYTSWYGLLDHRMVGYVERALFRRAARRHTPVSPGPAGQQHSASPKPGDPGHHGLSPATIAWSVAGAKVAADILIFDPPYLATFFTSTHLLGGGTFPDAWARFRADFPTTYVIDVAVWAPIQLVNFRFVPLIFQPVCLLCTFLAFSAIPIYGSLPAENTYSCTITGGGESGEHRVECLPIFCQASCACRAGNAIINSRTPSPFSSTCFQLTRFS
jgi:hypothetical protein